MMDIEAGTPEGLKEAERLQSTLSDISRAVRVEGMGPHTGMINQLVELNKGTSKVSSAVLFVSHSFVDLDMIESALANPGSKPLGAVDAFDVSDPHTQALLNVVRKMQPDEQGGEKDGISLFLAFVYTHT